jgi:hypothetical protein
MGYGGFSTFHLPLILFALLDGARQSSVIPEDAMYQRSNRATAENRPEET